MCAQARPREYAHLRTNMLLILPFSELPEQKSASLSRRFARLTGYEADSGTGAPHFAGNCRLIYRGGGDFWAWQAGAQGAPWQARSRRRAYESPSWRRAWASPGRACTATAKTRPTRADNNARSFGAWSPATDYRNSATTTRW